MHKALVTGAAGFIGSHVVRELLQTGVAVRALLRPGENTIRIEVANTLYRQVSAQANIPNFFGPRSLVVEPSGIVGEVALIFAD